MIRKRPRALANLLLRCKDSMTNVRDLAASPATTSQPNSLVEPVTTSLIRSKRLQNVEVHYFDVISALVEIGETQFESQVAPARLFSPEIN